MIFQSPVSLAQPGLPGRATSSSGRSACTARLQVGGRRAREGGAPRRCCSLPSCWTATRPALRRAGPAGGDRAGAGAAVRGAARRRADERAGRDGAGRDPRPPAAGCGSETGMSVLFISHDLGRDRRALRPRRGDAAAGRSSRTGPAREVLHAAREDYTKELVAAVPRSGRGRGVRDRPAARSSDLHVRFGEVRAVDGSTSSFPPGPSVWAWSARAVRARPRSGRAVLRLTPIERGPDRARGRGHHTRARARR